MKSKVLRSLILISLIVFPFFSANAETWRYNFKRMPVNGFAQVYKASMPFVSDSSCNKMRMEITQMYETFIY